MFGPVASSYFAWSSSVFHGRCHVCRILLFVLLPPILLSNSFVFFVCYHVNHDPSWHLYSSWILQDVLQSKLSLTMTIGWRILMYAQSILLVLTMCIMFRKHPVAQMSAEILSSWLLNHLVMLLKRNVEDREWKLQSTLLHHHHHHPLQISHPLVVLTRHLRWHNTNTTHYQFIQQLLSAIPGLYILYTHHLIHFFTRSEKPFMSSSLPHVL